MAYGAGASHECAVAKFDRASERWHKLRTSYPPGHAVEEQAVVNDLMSAVAYLCDAVRYLKDGVP